MNKFQVKTNVKFIKRSEGWEVLPKNYKDILRCVKLGKDVQDVSKIEAAKQFALKNRMSIIHY